VILVSRVTLVLMVKRSTPWIKYSDNADGTGLYDVPKASTLYIGIATNNQLLPNQQIRQIMFGRSSRATRATRANKDLKVLEGPKGDNGVSQYVHIRYSANSNGNPMTESPQATTKYIGLANTTSSTAPTGYASYTWSLIKGSDGVDGIQGPAGEDGNPNYTWVKYADDELGENMSDYPSGKMYIGFSL